MSHKVLSWARRSASLGWQRCERGARKKHEHARAVTATTEVNQQLDLNVVADLGPQIKTKIGDQLRLMYDEVVNQGVPDRFIEILRGLNPRTSGGSKNGSR
jgi:hypothetical protein